MKVFLSYKSQQSDIVRYIASWLRHNGVDCWFAEDQIPLDGQEDGDTVIQGVVRGIVSATHVLLFTNDSYAYADWCQIEFRLIRARGLLTRRTAADVRIPLGSNAHPDAEITRTLWGDTANEIIPHMRASGTELPDLVVLHSFLRKECGWPLPEAMNGFVADQSQGIPSTLPAMGLTLRLPGWSAEHIGIMRQGDDFEMPQSFSRDINGRVEVDIRTNRFSREVSPYSTEGPVDDLEQRRQAYAMARSFRDQLPKNVSRQTEIKAVHLVFLGDRSHFAISYTIDTSDTGIHAERKYILVCWDEQTRFTYEFVITFDVFGPMERLTALSPLMDATIQSFGFSQSAMKTFRLTNGDYLDTKSSTSAVISGPHPLSGTEGPHLSRLDYPIGYFDVPPGPSTGRFWTKLWSRYLRRKQKPVFSQAGGFGRLTEYV